MLARSTPCRSNAAVATELYRVVLPVLGIEAAADFYEAVLNLEGRRLSGSLCHFDCSGVVLSCKDVSSPHGPLWPPHSQYLYFSVLDVGATRQCAVSAGVLDVEGIQVMPWGERLFYAKDPFGNPICFVEQSAEVHS